MVERLTHPRQSVLWSMYGKGDFIDGFATQSTLALKDAAERAFDLPKWAALLLALRNRLVAPFGLKTDIAQTGPLFPVHYESADEILYGLDDRHLDFRISFLKQEGRIHMATWVHPHNIWGRAYLAIVMPFHILIVRNGMRRLGP